MVDINIQLGIPVYKNGLCSTTPIKLGIRCQGPGSRLSPPA